MANEEQLSILKQGVKVWNEWRQTNSDADIDLSSADLRNMNFRRVDLTRANLVNTNLIRTDFSEANFTSADLTGANLNGANLYSAILSGANLTDVDLSATILFFTTFSWTMLLRTNFASALLGNTVFISSDLTQAINLDRINHRNPSNIGEETLAISKGNIPEVFLKGCGLSDWEIEFQKLYGPDLSEQAIDDILRKIKELRAKQPFKVLRLFISYSHADHEFVDKLENSLTEKGVRCWRDNHELKAGRIEIQLERAIRENPKVLLVLSSSSVKSDWVEHEVRTARSLEKEMSRDVLCPVALDDSWKSSHWPKRIMEQIIEYNILDFSEWQDDGKFENMFRKLIDGLELFYKR